MEKEAHVMNFIDVWFPHITFKSPRYGPGMGKRENEENCNYRKHEKVETQSEWQQTSKTRKTAGLWTNRSFVYIIVFDAKMMKK